MVRILEPMPASKPKRVYTGVHIGAYFPPEIAAFIRDKASEDNHRASVSEYLNNLFRALKMQADKKEETQNGKPKKES